MYGYTKLGQEVGWLVQMQTRLQLLAQTYVHEHNKMFSISIHIVYTVYDLFTTFHMMNSSKRETKFMHTCHLFSVLMLCTVQKIIRDSLCGGYTNHPEL